MMYVSTRGRAPSVSFRDALFAGLAPDGGLYVPESLPSIAIEELRGATLAEVGLRVGSTLFGADIAHDTLDRLLQDALNFPTPLVQIDDTTWALELFHGPTFAFKDVGARVMARLMAQWNDDPAPLTVLVATSGDTGSAVAQAFFGVQGTRVIVLFPEGQVSAIQEAQFATLGGNVSAVAVAGTFDDCQGMVKQAFADASLRARARLTSANSINIGRLLPQLFYYFQAAAQVGVDTPAVFSVPSGNFGNLTAGLMARASGAPVAQFVAATTINDTVPRYLATGRYEPRQSVPTLANSMDVGDPSNVERMRWLFGDDIAVMRGVVIPSVHTDDQVRSAIGDTYTRRQYLCDPHSAIALLGLGQGDSAPSAGVPRVFLATAHPAKFRESVEPIIGAQIPIPAALAEALARPRQVKRIAPQIDALAALL